MGTLLRRSLAAESWLSNGREFGSCSDEHFDLVCYGNLSNVENSFSSECSSWCYGYLDTFGVNVMGIWTHGSSV